VNTIEFLREQLGQARTFLDGTMSEVGAAAVHAPMPGVCNPIDATYAHLVIGEDGFVNGLLGGAAPLFASEWAGRTGLSELPPQDADWSDWATRVQIDVPALKRYGAAVAVATDAYIAALSPEDLDTPIDLSSFGFGQRSRGWVLGSGVLAHVLSHWGEICALQGVLGGKGFPR
jgi:hypothetical protein